MKSIYFNFIILASLFFIIFACFDISYAQEEGSYLLNFDRFRDLHWLNFLKWLSGENYRDVRVGMGVNFLNIRTMDDAPEGFAKVAIGLAGADLYVSMPLIWRFYLMTSVGITGGLVPCKNGEDEICKEYVKTDSEDESPSMGIGFFNLRPLLGLNITRYFNFHGGFSWVKQLNGQPADKGPTLGPSFGFRIGFD